MKNLILLIIVLVSSNILLAQHITVANTRLNIIYMGIDNPISITVENYDCDDLIIYCTNGLIKQDDGCQYTIRTSEVGEVKITVNIKKDGEITALKTIYFRSQRIPPPVAQVARKSGGEVSVNEFKLQKGVGVVLEGFDFDVKYAVTNYSCIIITFSNKEAKFIDSSSEAKFTNKMTSAFNKIKVGDEVIFYDIRANGPDERQCLIESIKFDIIE
ncbi:MAG: GldM family protein [Chitinophagales bacterium]